MVELGDLYSAETRKVLLKFQVPALAALGAAKIATLEVAYVELSGLVEHVASLPINVNVVPGDEAAGRVPHPVVHSEVLFQEAQEAKKQASEAFERGDLLAGRSLLGETSLLLSQALEVAPLTMKDGLDAEIDDVRRMDAAALDHGTATASKMTRASYSEKSRKRGR